MSMSPLSVTLPYRLQCGLKSHRDIPEALQSGGIPDQIKNMGILLKWEIDTQNTLKTY